MTESDSQDQHGKSSKSWIGALVILCAVILGYGGTYSTNTISDPPELLGRYLVLTVFVWIMFQVIFLRKQKQSFTAIAFVSIFLALYLGGLISAHRHKNQATQVISSVQQELNRVSESITNPEGGFPAPTKILDPQPTASSEHGEIERFMKDFINRIMTQRNNYILELNAIGWNRILDPERIKNDISMSESKIIIQKAKSILEKQEAETLRIMQISNIDLNSYKISEDTKRRLLIGFNSGMEKSKNQRSEFTAVRLNNSVRYCFYLYFQHFFHVR